MSVEARTPVNTHTLHTHAPPRINPGEIRDRGTSSAPNGFSVPRRYAERCSFPRTTFFVSESEDASLARVYTINTGGEPPAADKVSSFRKAVGAGVRREGRRSLASTTPAQSMKFTRRRYTAIQASLRKLSTSRFARAAFASRRPRPLSRKLTVGVARSPSPSPTLPRRVHTFFPNGMEKRNRFR